MKVFMSVLIAIAISSPIAFASRGNTAKNTSTTSTRGESGNTCKNKADTGRFANTAVAKNDKAKTPSNRTKPNKAIN